MSAACATCGTANCPTPVIDARPVVMPCPACNTHVGLDANGRMNRHGNLNTGECPAVTR